MFSGVRQITPKWVSRSHAEKRGERIVVVHTKLDKSPQQICDHLATLGLPNLWLPSPDSFIEVEKIPSLGTGKLDLKGLSELARERLLA